MKVELTGLTHTNPTDLDFLLVGPNGQTFVIMSDMAGTADVTNLNFTLTDTAATAIPTTLVGRFVSSRQCRINGYVRGAGAGFAL
jgi:hypothetical protein